MKTLSYFCVGLLLCSLALYIICFLAANSNLTAFLFTVGVIGVTIYKNIKSNKH